MFITKKGRFYSGLFDGVKESCGVGRERLHVAQGEELAYAVIRGVAQLGWCIILHYIAIRQENDAVGQFAGEGNVV